MNLEKLKSKIAGSVLIAESEDYDRARTPWDMSVIQWPQVIVVAENTSDIREAVLFAKDNDLKISVKNTGHGVALPADDNLLIVTASMNEVEINPDEKTARIGPGAKWSDVLEKAQVVGLAPLMGSSTDVGAIGYTLGGGMGWLARKYGLAVDSVLSYDVITADGKMLHVSKSENEDLFWGLSGGGAALGIVTTLEIQLFPVETVYAGSLIYPRESAREVFLHYKEWLKEIDEDWTTSIALMNLPSVPFIPEFMRGQSVVFVRGCCVGSIEKGAKAIQSWLDWKDPMANLFKKMPFQDADSISDDPKEPSPSSVSNLVLQDLPDEAIDVLLNRGLPEKGPTPLLMVELRQTGGAIDRIDANTNSYSQRYAAFVLVMVGMIPTPEAHSAFEKILRQLKHEMAPYSTGGVCLNFLSGNERWNHTKAVFSPEAYQKLLALKKMYDPQNIFCFSLNIPTE